MPNAAVPSALGRDFENAPPGHRFRLYFDAWQQGFEQLDNRSKRDATGPRMPQDCRDLVAGVLRRQKAAAEAAGAWSLVAEATAPLVTGMGAPHPLENGFSFLDPYGWPYLAGSSVKGVFRRAVEELVILGDGSSAWALADLWDAFGFDETCAAFDRGRTPAHPGIEEERKRWREGYVAAVERSDPEALGRCLGRLAASDEEKAIAADPRAWARDLAREERAAERRRMKSRGELCFWDAIPEASFDRMRTDILNPHHGEYYGKSKPPSDDGSPIPVYFPTVPPEVRWHFFVSTTTGSAGSWSARLEEAAEVAMKRLGFGAKTSSGYGRMRRAERSAGDGRA